MGWAHVAAIGALVAAVASCSGKVTGGISLPAGAQNVGTLIIGLGPNPSVFASFDEVRQVPDASVVGTSTALGMVDDGTRQCFAIVNVDLPPSSAYVTTAVSAGPISVTGGQGPLTLLPSFADAGAGVDYNANGASTFVPGDVVTFAGMGSDDVPPFTLTLTVPNAITWSAPAAVGTWAIEQSMDLPVAWTGGGSLGSVYVSVSLNVAKASYLVRCIFPENANGGVVPASLLDTLPRNTIGSCLPNHP